MLPLLGPALRRQPYGLLVLRDGLSLSERLTLGIVRDGGRPSAGQAFAELTTWHEPLPYLGDLMFHVLLRALLEEPDVLLHTSAPKLSRECQPLALIAAGREVLAGRRYRLDLGTPERWVGGVRLRAGTVHWALDEQDQPVWREDPRY